MPLKNTVPASCSAGLRGSSAKGSAIWRQCSGIPLLPEWHKYIVIGQDKSNQVRVTDRPLGFWGDFESNYRPRHAENMAAMRGAPASTAT
jgi:hypothetical protein